MAYFDFVDKVGYEGPSASEPFAFRFYDSDRIVLGKPVNNPARFKESDEACPVG